METTIKRICDKCNNFHVSPSCSTEVCYAPYRGSQVIQWPTKLYIEARINGEVNHCKAYEKIRV